MGKTRICGKRCHNAKNPKCRCWCGGTFHGADGEAARATFAETFRLSKLPTTAALFDELTQPRLFDNLFDGNDVPRTSWRDRVAAGVAAQQAADKKTRRRSKGAA